MDWFNLRLKKWHNYIPNGAPATDLATDQMSNVLPAYTPAYGYGWVYTTTTFWYIGIPAWQGALREQAAPTTAPAVNERR